MTGSLSARDDFRLNNFDLLRLLAATEVLIFHAKAHLGLAFPAWADSLWHFRGVPVFFVISGFLISASYERSSGIGSYFRNRALRIFPGLWACISITVLVASLFGFSFLHPAGLAWYVAQLGALIYTPGFLKDFGFGSYNGSLWTIPVEIQFYFVLPVLYWLARRSKISLDAVLIAAFVLFSLIGICINHLFPDMLTSEETRIAKLLKYAFFTHFYMFLAGTLLQRHIAVVHRFLQGKGVLWLAAYIAVVNLKPAGAIGDYLALMMLAVAVVSLAYTLPSLSSRLLRGNDISYGVYIYHGLVLNILVSLSWTGSAISLLATVGGATLAAWLSWILIEKPSLRLKRQSLRTTEAALPV